MGIIRISIFSALLILAVLTGLIYAAPQTALPEPGERISLALVERDSDRLLAVRPIFVFYSSGKAVFLDGGMRGIDKDPNAIPKYSVVGNIDRVALMRDVGEYTDFSKFHPEYTISQPEDPHSVMFLICQAGDCKKIKIIGNPITCRRRMTDCNLGQLPPELNRAIDYLSDFVHPEAEPYPLPKLEITFTPKSKDEANGAFGRPVRGLPVPLVNWPSDWPGLSGTGADGKYHILLEADKFPRLVELAKGLHVEDFGVVRDGLLVISGKTGLPSVSIPIPGVDAWLKN